MKRYYIDGVEVSRDEFYELLETEEYEDWDIVDDDEQKEKKGGEAL